MPTALTAAAFLASLGVNTHVDQGYDANKYVVPLQYTGMRNIRDGSRNIASDVMLHQKTGVLVDVIGNCDLATQLAAARQLASAHALLALEGTNEPNNWPVFYNGQRGGGSGTWLPLAQCQRDLYNQTKSDPALGGYPVFHISEGGAEVDNVGLQFLTIPSGATTVMPEGTRYGDFANSHNYVSGHVKGYIDNQAWQAADPTLNGPWDGLYGEYGRTWKRGFAGYSKAQLLTLPRATTETGWDTVSDTGGEPVQGKILVNTYLAQFARGWKYTFVYELIDGEGGDGNQGFYHADITPKLAATYLHNLTSILAGSEERTPGSLTYTIPNQPATVHDLLLQKSSATFDLVVWGEQVSGSNTVTVQLGAAYPTVNVYDVTIGIDPVTSYHNVGSVSLVVSDHALIVEVAAGNGAAHQ
jgi:hypothetical protein